jgi:hypothetical protein
MLIPKFSLRSLLLLMALVGAVSLVISMAVQGQAWAIAVSAALAGLVATFALFVMFFLLAAPMALLVESLGGRPVPASPFATQQPPPQIIPPQEPE